MVQVFIEPLIKLSLSSLYRTIITSSISIGVLHLPQYDVVYTDDSMTEYRLIQMLIYKKKYFATFVYHYMDCNDSMFYNRQSPYLVWFFYTI